MSTKWVWDIKGRDIKLSNWKCSLIGESWVLQNRNPQRDDRWREHQAIDTLELHLGRGYLGVKSFE